MKTIDILFEYFQDQAEYIFPREVLENALFFTTASAMALKNIRIERNRTNIDGTRKIIIPNYFGITLGSSGIGKNFSRNLSRSIYDAMFNKFVSRVDEFIESRRDGENKLDKRYIRITDYYLPITSSPEGIQKAAQTVGDYNCGSINLVSDELAEFISRSDLLFAKLKTAWDDGISEGQVNVSDGNENYFTVTNICYNALLFGSPAPFELDPKKKDKLLESYVSGMARRSFIYHNNSYRKSEHRNMTFESMDESKLQTVRDYIKELRSFINNCKVIKLDDSVRKKLIDYDIQKEVLRENSSSLIAEDLGSIKKIEKLLGIIACLDLSSEINEKHLAYAIDFTERMDKTAEQTVEIKPIYIRIYNELEKRAFTARTDIIKAIKDVTLKSLEDEMILVEEHANKLGNSLV